MDSPLQPLLDRIKAAREQKGLSQRALGERVGLPQSHISKIESGAVDLQASSLLEIARALDLELTLVPRVALPAVRAIQQEAQQTEVSSSRTEIDRQLRALPHRAALLVDRFPRTHVFAQLVRAAKQFQAVPLVAIDDGGLRELTRALKTVLGQLKQIDSTARNSKDTAALIHAIEDSSKRLIRVLKGIADGVPEPAPQRPAYRLDNEKESDG